jgi:hypothetical protein
MFGPEKKKKKVAEWSFDLEVELKDPAKLKKMKSDIDTSVQSLKGALRGGGDKKEFDDTQTLLHGYLAVQKIIQRMAR